MVNFGSLAAEIGPVVWGTPANFNGFRVLVALLHGTHQWASAKVCGVEQRAPPIFGRAAITLGIGPHSGLCLFFMTMSVVVFILSSIKLSWVIVRWLGTLVVLHVVYMLIWPWSDPTSRSTTLTFWNYENLRAGRGYNLVIVIAGRPLQLYHRIRQIW